MANGDTEAKAFWVGIGASAGGLEALRDLVRHLSPDIGAIYVILQHMSPQHKSLLTELIGRETELEVLEITDGVVPEKGCVYISPPNHDVVVRAGRLRLLSPSTELAAPKPSVDRFFRSLAETLGDRAIGIVLSGTGSDGAYGVRAIRAAGGITIAQSESSAKYDGMPLSAIDTGCVDLVLSPEEIGARFDRIIRMPRNLDGIVDEPPLDTLSELFKMLRTHTGVDFREYKPSTVRRRIERRMAALELSSLNAYTDHIVDHPDEIDVLFRDMMISVTSFFRDKEEFDLLRTRLSEAISDRRGEGLRVWVPGCATGEEAYSIAFMVADILGGIEALGDTQVQIFATDIDSNALSIARRGLYPDTIAADVPEKILKTYFSRSSDGYQVNQTIRDQIVFTPHNLCQDPPFSNIDLISCRNLLIYFAASLQTKVFIRLHYALKPNGVLFLGKSEAISGSEALFKPMGKSGQIFQRRSYLENKLITPQPGIGVGRLGFERRREATSERSDSGDIYGPMFHALVRSIGPNGLLVSPDMHIQRVYGNINRFLSLSEGQVRGATITMLREDLRHELRTLIPLSLRNGEVRKGLERRANGEGAQRVQARVYPVGAAERPDDYALVIFHEWEEEPPKVPAMPFDDEVATARISELEQEVIGMRESLQQTSEELETANEELQSLNEELQSANEELQSTNEELETANEELQSTNEELITVNEELQINSHEMAVMNQELDSILSNIAAPVLVVDARLHIVQCSQSARIMFKIETGVAKPHLSQLSLPGEFPPLTSFMANVIHTGARAEREIETDDFNGTVVAAPYFNPKGELIGATAIVHEVADPRTRDLDALMDALPLMIWQKDEADRILHLNKNAAEFMGVRQREAEGQVYSDLMRNEDPEIIRLERRAVETGEARLNLNTQDAPRDGKPVPVRKHLVPYRHDDGSTGVFIVSSPKPPAPSEEAVVTGRGWQLDAESGEVTLSDEAAELLKMPRGNGKTSLDDLIDAIHPDDRVDLKEGIGNTIEEAVPFMVRARLRGSRSKSPQFVLSGTAERENDGTVAAITGQVAELERRKTGAKAAAK